jgi:hypothetical protein
MANVTYPQMIAAFKTWYGQNKTRPSNSVEIDGQPAVRKSSFGEMLQAGLTQLGIQAALGGFEFIKGGTAGLNKFLDTLPKELSEPARALAKSAGDAVNSLKTGIDGLIPEGGNLAAFKTTVEGGLQSVTDNFINPIGDVLDGAKAALNGDISKLSGLQALYADDPSLSGQFGAGLTKLGSVVTGAIDKAKGWSNELTLGTGDFKLTDAFDIVNSSHTKFMAEYLGIGDVPTLTSLVGTLARPDLYKDLVEAKDQLEKELLNLRKSSALKYPVVNIDDGLGGTIPTTNPEIAELGLNSLSLADQAVLIDSFDFFKEQFDAAAASVETAGNAIKLQVQSDQQNILVSLKAQNSLDDIGLISNTYVGITNPEQKALFESTVKPDILETTKAVAPLILKATTPVDPNIT